MAATCYLWDMVTIHDVAKAAGVSTATVSRSFAAGHPLSRETRQRVLRAAETLDYRPRRRAVRPAIADGGRGEGSKVTSIGFQFFASAPADRLSTNAFYGPVLAGAQATADTLGMHILLNTTYRHRLTQGLPQMIREQAVDGMLLVGTADPEILHSFLRFVKHIVLVDNRDITQQHDCIVSNGFGGGMTATQRLIDLGHRRIGFVMARAPEVTFEDRLNGYICAHYRSGIPIDMERVITVGAQYKDCDVFESADEIAGFLRRTHADSKRPTAFVAANDDHALAVIHACRQLDIRVPTEMSVIGFDDVEFAAHVFPALTTVRVDKEQMGRLAVRQLQMRLDPDGKLGNAEPPVVIQVPVALIERESCAEAPRN